MRVRRKGRRCRDGERPHHAGSSRLPSHRDRHSRHQPCALRILAPRFPPRHRGIAGTDHTKIFHPDGRPPQILGHELAGTVVAVGPGVTKWKPGDRVMSFHHTPCGKCFYCEKRLFSQCKQYKTTGLTGGFSPNGRGFAEYVKAIPWGAEPRILALPANVSFEETTFIEPLNTIVKR